MSQDRSITMSFMFMAFMWCQMCAQCSMATDLREIRNDIHSYVETSK